MDSVRFARKTKSGFCACPVTFKWTRSVSRERRNLVSAHMPSHFNWPATKLNSNGCPEQLTMCYMSRSCIVLPSVDNIYPVLIFIYSPCMRLNFSLCSVINVETADRHLSFLNHNIIYYESFFCTDNFVTTSFISRSCLCCSPYIDIKRNAC